VRDGHAKLSTGPLVNRHRPAVDVMFASAADWVDGHTVAVVLSGALDDGAVGVALVDLAGGQVLVQDPVEAEFGGMPQAALAAAPRSRAFSASRLALEIRHCLGRAKSRPSHRKAYEARMEADMDMLASDNPAFLRENESQLTRLTCPECGGAMAQVDLPKISYFRCHVGHQFGPQALAAAQLEASERRLWSAVAALEEQAAVLHHVQRHAPREQKSISSDQDQNAAISARYADEVASRAAALRDQVRAWSSGPSNLSGVR
jgi:two-component system chemotaxis response regulator CheB